VSTPTLTQHGTYSGGAWAEATTFTSSVGGMVFTFPLAANQTALVWRAATLTLTQANTTAGTTTVYLRTDTLTPSLFSTSDPPEVADGDEVGTATNPASVGGTTSVVLDTTVLTPYYRQAGWNGRLSLILDGSAATWTGASCSIALTGAVGVESGTNRWARTHSGLGACARCGDVRPRSMLRRDGYRPGLQVCERCWDPAESDPVPPRPERPPRRQW